MKIWGIVLSIIVILTIFCSPALAVSMSDLIAQHQGESPQLIERLEFDEDTPICCDGDLFERHRAPNFTVIQNIAVPIPTTIPTPVTPSSYVLPGVMPRSNDSDPVTIRDDPRATISLDELTPRPNYTVIQGITIPKFNTRGL